MFLNTLSRRALVVCSLLLLLAPVGACQTDTESPALPDISGEWCIHETYYLNGSYDGQWFTSVAITQNGPDITVTAIDECEYLCGSHAGTLDALVLTVPMRGDAMVVTFSPDGDTFTGTWNGDDPNDYHTFVGNRGRCF